MFSWKTITSYALLRHGSTLEDQEDLSDRLIKGRMQSLFIFPEQTKS